MRSLYQILMTLFIAQPLFAADYEGLIARTRPKMILIDSKTKVRHTLTFKNVEIEKQVKKLARRDFISFEGVRSLSEGSIRVDSVNYVGLTSMIGKWKGNDRLCYEFMNYVEMYIFAKNKNNRCEFSNRFDLGARYMTYTVNPTSDGWIALISDDITSYASEVTLKSPARMDLSLYDSETGDILGTIILKK